MWSVNEQVVAPELSEFITRKASEKVVTNFSSTRRKLLKEYNLCSSETARKRIPGAAYFKKIHTFIADHYEIGELYMEYRKGACEAKGNLCTFCSEHDWVGPVFYRILKLERDYSKLPAHTNLSQKPRDPDDFQPK